MLVFLPPGAVRATEDGDLAASAISAQSYQSFMDGELYAHIGDNRGFGPEHDLARQNIVTLFESYGLTVTLEPVQYSGQTYWNVVGTKPGLAYPEREWIVAGHYDSVNNPGADDDASGIALVLEVARVLGSYPSQDTIRFIAFDREEQGLYGSVAYVNSHGSDNILGMIQSDMVAYDVGSSHVDVYGRDSSLPLKAGVVEAMNLYSSGISTAVGGRRDSSDHASFEGAGFQACHVREDLGNPWYHTPDDNVDVPNYIDYIYGTEIARGIAGFLVDHTVIAMYPCGDGLVSGNERCDTGIPSGQPGACPETCSSADPCALETVRAAGTCLAFCDVTGVITNPIDGDGCCPTGANAVMDDDCLPVCGNAVCEQNEETTCVEDCICGDDADCDDNYGCTQNVCSAGTCQYLPAAYGDVDQNGFITIADVFCILDGFAGVYEGNCTPGHVDVHPCIGNGVINILDVFAVLDAYQGEDPCCGAPAMPTTEQDRTVAPIHESPVPEAALRFVTSETHVPRGGSITVDVYLGGAVRLQAYEVTLQASAADGDSLLPTDALLRDEPNYVFADQRAIRTMNKQRCRIAGVLREGSVTPAGEAYLGTCTFAVPADSRGPFRIAPRPDETAFLNEQRRVFNIKLIDEGVVTVR